MQDLEIRTKKICDIVSEDANIILPAIQRKFVWKEEQIYNLFESIMNGYPIGTFLIWEITGEQVNKNEIGFYEFIKNYSEYDRKYNDLLQNTSNERKFLAILDGQQRIQSLLIGLRGTYATHLSNKPYDKIESFPKKKLYLNLKKVYSEIDEKEKYIFKFIETEIAKKDSDNYWFEVGKILYLNKEELQINYLKENYHFSTEEEKNEALVMLLRLNTCINARNLLGCYIIDKNSNIDEVLEIFVKINSGGTALSKPDLLFSTIIAKWSDAREEFDSFIKNINICDGQRKKFNFNIDFLIRTIMYIFDISVTLNINNFKKLNIELLKKQWKKIKNSFSLTRNLLIEFGFDDDNIMAYNAIMPIIYYVYNDGNIKNEKVKEEIKKYFIIAQLKNLFGTASNSTLTEMRKAIKNEKNFNMNLLKNITLVGNRNFLLNDDNEILNWIDKYKKGDSYTFMILSIIDSNYDSYKNIDEDHLYPESILKKNPEFKKYKDSIANINLLQAKENRKIKNDMLLDEYIKYLENQGKNPDVVIKCLPKLDKNLKDYSLSNFLIFYEKRKKLLLNEIKRKLKI